MEFFQDWDNEETTTTTTKKTYKKNVIPSTN